MITLSQIVGFVVSSILIFYVGSVISSTFVTAAAEDESIKDSHFYPIIQLIAKYWIIYCIGLVSLSFVGLFVPTKEVILTEEEVTQGVKPHRQTYFEYVKERLAVEKVMR